MTDAFPILSAVTFTPLLGVLLILLFAKTDQLARLIAFGASALTFGISLALIMAFNHDSPLLQFNEYVPWFDGGRIGYRMGVDGLSVYFVVLSALLTPLAFLASWHSIEHRVKEYMIAFLVLETMMIGTFCALDAVLFYLFFEGSLIPMFLIIGVWGGARRIYSAFKFFLFTLLGSVFMLIAIIYMGSVVGTTDMLWLASHAWDPGVQKWLFLAFLASFAVKLPMWPVHTWLPDAHVEAPTAGSVILAGILLKMGGYGFLRFSLPMFPDASQYFAPMMMVLAVIAIVYTSLVALAQTDMKKMIAYSSVAHMGFVTLGLFSFTEEGMQGAVFQMISHGVLSAALFLCVGVVYDRLHTREIARYGGLAKNMPNYTILFVIFMLGSVGLPGTSGFVGEMLALVGAFKYGAVYAVLGATGMVLGAAYMLLLTRKVVFGPQDNPDAAKMDDIVNREWLVLVPLAVLAVWWGIQPNGVLHTIQSPIKDIAQLYLVGGANAAP